METIRDGRGFYYSRGIHLAKLAVLVFTLLLTCWCMLLIYFACVFFCAQIS